MHSVKIAIEKARCELSSKSFRAASATLEDALKLSPNNYQLWQDYGFALYRQDKHRAAHSALKHAIELKATDQGYYLIAQVLVSLHKEAEAGVYLKKALQLNPNHREARVLLRSLN
jgi:Tfp pilus assembly protein PilF